MPNGTDCSCLLQTEPLHVPTQWAFFDLTSAATAFPWLGGEASLDYLKVDSSRQAADFLLHSYEARLQQGCRGRQVIWFLVDLADAESRRCGLNLPLELANLMFWETNQVPSVLRVLLGPAQARQPLLRQLQYQYFAMPDFTGPYYGEHVPGRLYANEFDSCLVTENVATLQAVVRQLVTLHREETRLATQGGPDLRGAGGLLIIEHTMQASQSWRKIDWLATAMYPYFPRLWDLDRKDLLEILDISRCAERLTDPWAPVKKMERERDWEHLRLGPVDPPEPDPTPYRLAPEAVRARLPLARFLQRHSQHLGVLEQCDAVRGRVHDEPLWLRVEGMSRLALDQPELGKPLLQAYLNHLLADCDGTPAAYDQIWGMAMMLDDWPAVVNYAHQALQADPRYLRAYDALVIVSRQTGDPRYEEQARALASEHMLEIPILRQEAARRAPSNDLDELVQASQDSAIVRVVNLILAQAVKDEAWRVRIDPTPGAELPPEATHVFFFVDQEWHHVMSPPRHVHPYMLARLKAMAGLDLARFDSQRGGFDFTLDERDYRTDLEFVPTRHGERVSLRLQPLP